ncbi:MAG: tetratricopeptide (TPR) repeat protein [Glaciecola sp.]|jgi:tetratricopeptide (TPR) repeat protein
MKQLLLLFLLLVSFFCTSAEESVEKVMKLISQLGYEASIAQNEGKYSESEEKRAKLISLMRTFNAPKIELARQLSNLASIQNLNAKGVEAEESAIEALEILKLHPTNDQIQIAILNGNLAGALLLQNKLEASRKYYLKELAILEQIDQLDTHFAASARVGIGAIEAKLGNFLKAKELYESALEIFLKMSDETHPQTKRYIEELKKIKSSIQN